MAMVLRRVVAPLVQRSLPMGATRAPPSMALSPHAQIPVLSLLDGNQLRFKVTKKRKGKKGKKGSKAKKAADDDFVRNEMGGSGIGRVSAADQDGYEIPSREDPEELERYALQLVEENPKDPESYLMLGMVRWNVLGNLRDARSTFEDGLQVSNENTDLMHALGNCILSGASADEEHGEAIELFEKVVELDPDHGAAISDLALAYFLSEKEDKAVELLKGEVAKHPESAEIRVRLGTILQMAKRFDEAKAQFEEILKVPEHQNSIEALDSLAEIAWSRENPDFKEAEALHAKLLEAHPDKAGTYLSIARYHHGAHNNTEAAKEWTMKAGEVSPNDPYVADYLEELEATPKLE